MKLNSQQVKKKKKIKKLDLATRYKNSKQKSNWNR